MSSPSPSGNPRPSWNFKPLGSIARLVNGKAFSESDWSRTGLPIVRIQNLNDRRKPFNFWSGNVEKQVVIKSGELLLAWSGTPGTSFGAHIWDRGEGVLNQHIFRVDVDESMVDRSWLQLAINVQLAALIGKAHGAVGLRHVTRGEVEHLQIPLPSIGEQRRISGKVGELFQQVAIARAAAEARLEAARSLTSSFIGSLFEQGESCRWPKRRIAEFAQTASGTTPSRSRSDYYGGRIAWVKSSELLDGLVEDTEEHVTAKAVEECRLRILPARTCLVAMYGQGQTRGRTGLLTRPATINQACFAILPNDAEFDAAFLQGWFRYSYRRLRTQTEGRGGNQPNLNGALLRNDEVPLPSIASQKRIAAEIGQRDQHVRALLALLTEELSAAGRLREALLQRTFRGELYDGR